MTTKCWVFSLWSQLFVGFVLWNYIKCEDFQPCLDHKGKEVAHGDRFFPLGSDPCTQCTCLYGKPQMCIAVFCSPPENCRQYHALSDKCCEFVCLDRDFNNKASGNGTYPGKDALQCSAPPNIFDGTYTLTAQDKITIGTQAIYSCIPGYELSDPSVSSLTCILNKDGNATLWAGDIPACQALQCSAPPNIYDGTYTLTAQDKTEIPIFTQSIYSCIPGYELSDPSVSRLTCILNIYGNETLWAGDIPACQVIKPCSDPGISMNGTREGDCCLPGDIVSYSCNEGFEMAGEKDIECLLSKRWSSPRPLCKPLKKKHCELLPEIPNGVVLRMSGDYALADEEVEILCKPGFQYNGTNHYPYCNGSALWEDDEFGECVEIICDRPEPLVNGNIPELEKSNFTETFPNNFLLTYNCDKGYRLKGGDSWRVCLKEGWSGATPYCEEIFCPDPGVPENGGRLGHNFKVGAKVHFKCFAGYELLGSFERYCSPNGKWTGELTRCNAPTNYCPNPGIPINGMREGDSYNQGDTVEFNCAAGFIHSGSKRRTCRVDRTWNGTETKCLGTHDFDSAEEIGRILKQRLDEQFDEEIKEYKLIRMYAHGKVDNKMLDFPPYRRLIVYFAFDVSGSIGKVNFEKGIEFAKAIVRKIGVSENGSRVGALVFSNQPVNMFYPMDYIYTDDVLDALDRIEYLGGGTATTTALQMVIENIMLIGRQDYFNGDMKSVLFLITDGKPNMGGSPEYEAEFLKDKMKAEIFCIGITGDVRADVLYKIASTSKYEDEERPNVFILKNYERLNWLIQDIAYGTLDYGQCGLGMESKMNSNEGRMIGGKRSVEPWPWMATLFFRDPKKKSARPELKCGGSIINENFILTAAHCLFERDIETLDYRKKDPEEIIVKLGQLELRNQILFQEFEVENLYIHDDYMPGDSYDNDIALLKLNRPIMYGPFMRPVCLPPAVLPEDDNYPLYKPNEYGWVTGFGDEYQGKIYDKYERFRLPKEIKEFRLPIQPNATCRSSLGKEEQSFTERMFCAGDEKSGKSTCKGDSGSPFMQPHMNLQGQVYWTQVGIVSWGIGCGNEGHYGYYTKVQLFRSWIDEKMKEIVSKEGEE